MKTGADIVRDFANKTHGLPDALVEGLRLIESLPAPPPVDEVAAKRDEVAEARAAKERREQETLRRWTKIWGVPFLDAQQILTGELLVNTPALAAAYRLYERRQYGAILCLSGPNGCGKTLAASWLVTQGPPRPYPFGDAWPPELHPRFISVGELQRVSLFGEDADWRAYQNASVLAIDDVGTEYKDEKGAFAARFDQLIAAREKAPCWTILTTNLIARAKEGTTEPSFAGKYGERVIDRLRRDGCAFLHLRGDSLRQTSTKKTTPCPTTSTPTSPPTRSTPSESTTKRPPTRG